MQLSEWTERYAGHGINVVGVTYDAAEVLASFTQAQGLDYPLLGDRDATVVTTLGIRNEDYPPGHRAYGVPHPGILLLDGARRVVMKRAVSGYRTRPPFDELYDAVAGSLDE